LRDSEAVTKIVILLTDGENNAGRITPENAAQAAKALGVKVYTIGAGTDGYVKIPVQSPLGGMRYRRQWSQIDEGTLKRIADITGGRYFRAKDGSGLERVYDEIDQLEKTEIDVENFTQYEPRFAPFAVAGLLLFGLEKLLGLTRLGRLPL
jgi:Ca-activated chloride channel family protein